LFLPLHAKAHDSDRIRADVSITVLTCSSNALKKSIARWQWHTVRAPFRHHLNAAWL